MSSWDDEDYDEDSERELEEDELCIGCDGDPQGGDCDDCTQPLCPACNTTGSNASRRCSSCENIREIEAEAGEHGVIRRVDDRVVILTGGSTYGGGYNGGQQVGVFTIAGADPAALREQLTEACAERKITAAIGLYDNYQRADGWIETLVSQLERQ